MKDLKKSWFTVLVFTRLNTKRFFRDRLAIFFGILFPLIFLFVFGSINSGSSANFRVALINQSKSEFSQQFAKQLGTNKAIKVDTTVTNLDQGKAKMSTSQIDAVILLPPEFGAVKPGQTIPSGEAQVIFTQTNATAGQTLTSVLEYAFKSVNITFLQAAPPFSVKPVQLNANSLTAFDYTFAGLLGFAIVGLGIFGPVNVFPELKKQGILRRLHTTPLKVWQYFIATMNSQTLIGLVSLSVMFIFALTVFHLNIVGNIFEIIIYLIISIITILGIGLAIGGWARNERQAAPLSNIIVFPMLFLSGTFFPRFLMPHWLQTLSQYLPLTPVIEGIRMIVVEGKHLWQLGPQLTLLGLWMIVIYFIAFRVFRWE